MIQSPQQFEGRWVRVRGFHQSGVETSALHAPDWRPPAFPQDERFAEALWVDVPTGSADRLGPVELVGRFHRGPSGHLGAYFGRLDNHRLDNHQ